MALNLITAYGTAVNASLRAGMGKAAVLKMVNDLFEIPNAAQYGKLDIPVITDFTAATPVDGVPLTNGLNTTLASMTFTPQVVPIKLQDTQRANGLLTGASAETIVRGASDALAKSAINSLIATMVAATPGFSETLAAGKIDFAAATQAELALLDQALAYSAAVSDSLISELAIWTTDTGLGNLMAATGVLVNQPGVKQITQGADGRWTYGGVPIFGLKTGAANFGLTTKAAAFVTSRNALACKMAEVKPQGDGEGRYFDDGLWGAVYSGPYCYGLLNQTMIAEIINP